MGALYSGCVTRAKPLPALWLISDARNGNHGFAIGGVPPLAHDVTLSTWLDVRLLQYATVWAAAGSPFAVFGVTPHELQRATGADWMAVEASDAELLV